MNKQLTQSEIIASKKTAIRKLNNLLEKYIASANSHDPKKAYLISNWIQQFVSFVSFEDQFDPKRNISYKRGNVIKINFGFNIGCELGGPHYAVVLDKANKHSSNTITVVPLVSSKEGKRIYERDVFLGNELFNTLAAKYQSSLKDINMRLREINELHTLLDNVLNTLSSLPPSQERDERIKTVQEASSSTAASLNNINAELVRLNALNKEISLMKEGSVARVEQITTVSKQRIWIPQKTTDVLYNISYSENAMKKINERIKELFVFSE